MPLLAWKNQTNHALDVAERCNVNKNIFDLLQNMILCCFCVAGLWLQPHSHWTWQIFCDCLIFFISIASSTHTHQLLLGISCGCFWLENCKNIVRRYTLHDNFAVLLRQKITDIEKVFHYISFSNEICSILRYHYIYVEFDDKNMFHLFFWVVRPNCGIWLGHVYKTWFGSLSFNLKEHKSMVFNIFAIVDFGSQAKWRGEVSYWCVWFELQFLRTEHVRNWEKK